MTVALLGADMAAAHDARVAQNPGSGAAAGLARGAVDRRALSAPARNSLFSCQFQAMGDALRRPWVDPDGTIRLQAKPVVPGRVDWAGRLEVVRRGERIEIMGNGLPRHATGKFPVDPGSEAARWDRNPNVIRERRLVFSLPAEPRIAAKPGCLGGGPIGIALTGVVFFNALDADRRDALANELQDACGGHVDPHGFYHYHHGSPCLEGGDPRAHSPVVGYAFDGFAIHGPRDAGGRRITNAELDECHGHVGPAPQPDGSTRTVYHYHVNDEFPYTLGCFKGVVDQAMLRPQGGPPGGGQGGGQGGGPGSPEMGPGMRPPPPGTGMRPPGPPPRRPPPHE